MSFLKRTRVAKGVPQGGEFATEAKVENDDLETFHLMTGEQVTTKDLEPLLVAVRNYESGIEGHLGWGDVVSTLNVTLGDKGKAVSILIREAKARDTGYEARSQAMQAERAAQKANRLALISSVNSMVQLGMNNVEKMELLFAENRQVAWRFTWTGGMGYEFDGTPGDERVLALIDPRRPRDLVEFCEGYEPDSEGLPSGMVLREDGSLASMAIDIDRTLATRN